VHGRRIFNGFLLILIGVIFLGANLGYFHWSMLSNLWRLWPIPIVLAGLSIIFRRSLGWVVVLVLIGVVGAGILGHARDSGQAGAPGQAAASQIQSIPLPTGATAADVKLNFGAGTLTIGGGTDGLMELTHTPETWSKPDVKVSTSGSRVSLNVAQRSQVPKVFTSRAVTDWKAKFTTAIPLSFEINAGACEADLDLSAYRLSRLNLNIGACQITLSLGSLSPLTEVNINGGASSMTLKLPAGSGVRITLAAALSSANLDALGWEKRGKTYVTPGYDAAASKINVDIKTGVSELRVLRSAAGSTF
jgi:hypothetical protein